MWKRSIISIALVLPLASCFPGADSIAELKTKHASQYDFDVASHYEETYSVIVQTTRSCFTSSFGAPAIIQADLLPETRRAEVAIGSSVNSA